MSTYNKSYYELNKSKLMERMRNYYYYNKIEILEQKKKYYENSRNDILEQKKKYYEISRNNILGQKKIYYEISRNDKLEYSFYKYYKNNYDLSTEIIDILYSIKENNNIKKIQKY